MENLLQKAYFSHEIVEKSAHYHDCHQIIFITDGAVELCVNRANKRVETGNVMVFSRFENHSTKVLSERYSRFVLHLDPKIFGLDSRICSLLFNRPEGFCNVIDVSHDSETFCHLFSRIVHEYREENKLSHEMQRLLVSEMLILLWRYLPDLCFFDETIDAVRKALENAPQEQYNLRALATQYNMSVSSLSHQFKRVTGYSVMEYLLSCRMAEAKRLLVTTSLGVSEIVEACGFSDGSNFSRMFKNQNGLTPSQFRAKFHGSL